MTTRAGNAGAGQNLASIGGIKPVLTYVEDDLFTSPAQTLVNTVNLVGVMGKGIALQFKQVYPEMFRSYQTACNTGAISVGRPWLYKTSRKWILNFPTKRHWRQRSQLADIDLGLQAFVRTYADEGISSIAFPALGCGNGELSWSEVRPLLERHLKPLPIDVFIYPPRSKRQIPEHRDPDQVRDWLRSEPSALPVSEVWDDLLAAARARMAVTVHDDSTAEPGEPRRVLMLETEHGLVPVHEGDVALLWDAFRGRGFLEQRLADAVLGSASRPMWELLKSLPYVDNVVTYQHASQRIDTLQLRIPAARASTLRYAVLPTDAG